MAIEINGLIIDNLGNGINMKIKWSVIDPSNISFFIVERYDRHLRKWVAYDGFHGSVSAKENGSFSNPSYEVTATINDSPKSQQSFRVKAIFKDKTESKWSTASAELNIIDSSEITNRSYYIYQGLSVSAKDNLEITIDSGSAVFAGDIKFIENNTSFSLASNSKYIVFITESGIVSTSKIEVEKDFDYIKTYDYAGRAIRLANVTVSADNKITIQDTRALWHPQNVTIEQSSSDRLFVNLSWSEVLEPNTYKYKIYKGIGMTAEESDFYEIATIDAKASDHNIDEFPDGLSIGYEDSDNEISKGKTYWYKIATVDFNGKISPASAPQKVYFEVENQPAPPKNLSGEWGAYLDSSVPLLYLDLTWEQDDEEELNIQGYNVYLKRFGHWTLQETVSEKTWRHARISNGSTYTYAVTSFNEETESDLSIPLTIQVGDVTSPSAPQLDPLKPIATGGNENSVWVTLKWLPVTTNDDAEKTAITDLLGYNIYQVKINESEQKEYVKIRSVKASVNEIQIDMQDYARGTPITLAVTAYDYFSNESAKSSEATIVLGGVKPKPPVFKAEYKNDYGTDKVVISIDKVTKNINDEPLIGGIASYIIYRGRISNPSVELVKVIGSEDEVVQYIDLQITRGSKYYYIVKAIDSNGNISDAATEQSVNISDFTAPSAPQIIDYGTRVEDNQISNFIKFTMPEDEDVKGAYIYVSEDKANFEQIGFIYFNNDTEYEYIHSRNIKNGSTYQYLLAGVDFNNNITKFDSAAKTDYFIAGDVTPPQKVTVKLESLWENQDAGIKISWAASASENVVEYKIYRSNVTELGPYQLVDSIFSQELNTFEYKDRKLVNKSQYWYKIIAVNSLGVESDGCNYEDGYGVPVVAGDVYVPETPVLVSKKINYDKYPVVTTSVQWSTSDQVIKYYEIHFSSNRDYGYSFLLETESTNLSHNIAYGETIYYKIIAVSESGNKSEPLIEELTAVNTQAPERIQTLNYESIQQANGKYQVKLSWIYNPSPVFKAYKIYSVLPGNQLSLVSSVLDPLTKECTIENLKPGTEYSFAVTCIDKFDNEHTSDLIPITFTIKDTTAPSPVSNLEVKGKELGIELSWQEPTTNSDGTTLLDLAGYEIYYSSNNMNGDPITNGQLVTKISSNGFYHQVGGNKTYYYAVRAYDTSNNYSNFVESVEPATSLGITGSAFDTKAPSQLSAPTLDDYGIVPSEIDETDYVFASISWSASEESDISHYNIYLDGQYFSQTKELSYTLYGLRTGIEHDIKISAVDKVLNESILSESVKVPEIGYVVKPLAPIAKSIKQYLGGLIVEWEEPKKNGAIISHVKGYELQYAETDGIKPSEDLWQSLSLAKTTYNIHGRLKYNKYYHYRIRTVDTFGNQSDWTYFDSVGDGIKPAQTGPSDLAAQSVYAENLIADSVKSAHIASESLETRHLKSKIINGDHIIGKSIMAEHLGVRAGGRNLVSNSAFGMRYRDTGKLGIGWDLDGEYIRIIDKSQDENIPIVDHALEFYSINTASSMVIQKLETKERLLSISFNILTEYVIPNGDNKGIIIDLCTFNGTEYVRLSDDYFLITGSTENGWTLLNKVFHLPEYDNIHLRISFDNVSGLARITCVNVEEGDFATRWYPKEGETYGASGNVQVNPSGIIVENGKIKVTTNSDSNGNAVVIDSDGILAGNENTKYAKMTNSGFSSVGGAFSVVTGDSKDSSGISFDATGIRANGPLGKRTLELLSSDGSINLYGGKFSITTAEQGSSPSSFLRLNSNGIELYNNETIFKVDPVLNSTTIRGSFNIQSNASPQSNGGFEFSGSRFKAYSGDKKDLTFLLNADNGNVSIGSTLVLSSSGLNEDGTPKINTSSRIVISTKQIGENLPGIYSYKDGGELGFYLRNDGKAQFNNGSISIVGGNGSVTFDSSGLKGKDFSLTSSGLTVSNAVITNGNITMDSNGMTINDTNGQGIKVVTNSKPIVQINKEGIQVLEEKGISISDGGSLTIANGVTAIDSKGINADTISVGTLRINKSDGPKIIVGTDDVIIDSNGIIINNGKLSLFSEHESAAIIENGKVTANALELITTPGLNLLRNGTGSFDLDKNQEPDFWNSTNATLKVVTEIAEAHPDSKARHFAGLSSKYAIKVSGMSSSATVYQDIIVDYQSSTRQSAIKSDRIYTAIFNVYLVSGTAKVSVANTVDINGNVATPISITESNKWVTEKITFKSAPPTGTETEVTKPIERFLIEINGDNSLIYLTDLMVVEGNIKSGYFRHSSEVFSDGLISIRDGKFSITGANKNIHIDEDGIVGPTFSLLSSGLTLDFRNKESGILLDDKGILVGTKSASTPYVSISNAGFESNGMFALKSSTGLGDMTIDGNKIFMKNSSGSHSITMSPEQGIKAIGSSAFTIKTSDGDSDGISLTPEAFSVQKKNLITGKADDIVVIGKLPENITYAKPIDGNETGEKMGYGIYVGNGNFFFESVEDDEKGTASMKINSSSIEISNRTGRRYYDQSTDTHKEEIYSTLLNSRGLKYLYNGEEYSYNKRIYIPEKPVSTNVPVSFPGFTYPPKIIVVPALMQTYSSNGGPNQNMFVEFYADKVQRDSFVPMARLLFDSQTFYGYVEKSRSNVSKVDSVYHMGHNGVLELETEDISSRFDIEIDWKADKAHIGDVRDYVRFTLEFRYFNSKTSTWSPWEDKKSFFKEGGGLRGSNNTGRVIVSSRPLSTPEKIQVRITSDINDGDEVGENHVKITGIQYQADGSLEPSRPQKVWFIAIDDTDN